MHLNSSQVCVCVLTLGWKVREDRLFLGVSCQMFFKLNPTAVVKRSVVVLKARNVQLKILTGPSFI